MPFDIPTHLEFDVAFRPTKMHDKKFFRDQDSCNYLGAVGDGFKCVVHGDFYRKQHDTITEELTESDTLDPD